MGTTPATAWAVTRGMSTSSWSGAWPGTKRTYSAIAIT